MEDLTFGEQVKIILGRKGMTIKQLAELIEEKTGKKMSRQNLTQRLGRDNFQEQDMRMIASILECPFRLSIMSVDAQPQRSTAALERAAAARTEAVERRADIEPEEESAGLRADIEPEEESAGLRADIEPKEESAGLRADIEPEQGHSVVARVDCTDGAGAFYASEHLEIDSNRNATFVIPHDITRAGGMCRVNLVLSELDADNVEQRIIYSGTATLYFENSAQGTPPRNQYKRELSGLMGAAAAAAESAQDSANKLSQHNNDSEAHQPLKDYSDGNLIAHNTNSEAHADIRAEIEDMHAVNRIRLDAPLSVGVSGHYVRVLHRPPAGQELETIRFGLNGPIPEGAKKLVVWMKADRPLAAGVVALWLRTTPDANGGTTAQYPLEVGAEWAKLEIDLTALESKTGYQSMMFVIDSANSATADTSIYFDQISYIMEDGSTQMLYSFDDLTPTNYAPPQYAYGADGCNFYGVQAIGCVNVGTIDQSAGWMWHGEIEVMDKEDPAPDTGKYLTVKASYYCGDNSSLVTAEKTFLSTDCDFGLQYINLSHDPDAEELASVTSTRDPAGWTSIAVIQILNDMWQLPSVIWLDDVLYHDQSETAHADIRKELEAVGDDISAQIATHNSSNENVHPYILQSIPAQISGHNASAAAHADIRDELAAVGNDLGERVVQAINR